MNERLTPDEDILLRRLDALASLGVLSGTTAALYDELRNRDRRLHVRPPVDVVLVEPTYEREAGPLVFAR